MKTRQLSISTGKGTKRNWENSETISTVTPSSSQQDVPNHHTPCRTKNQQEIETTFYKLKTTTLNRTTWHNKQTKNTEMSWTLTRRTVYASSSSVSRQHWNFLGNDRHICLIHLVGNEGLTIGRHRLIRIQWWQGFCNQTNTTKVMPTDNIVNKRTNRRWTEMIKLKFIITIHNNT